MDSKPEPAQDDQVKTRMQAIGKSVHNQIPPGWAFLVMVFPTGSADGRNLRYVSNAELRDAINVVKEWLLKCGAAEDWMKEIK